MFFFVPSLSQNLLSVGQLMGNRFSVLFEDDSCVIKDRKTNQMIMKVIMTRNKLFPLELSNFEIHALMVKEKEESKLWHMRFATLVKKDWKY